VGGDKIKVGHVSQAAVAVGRGAQATLNQGVSGESLAMLFAPLYRQLEANPALLPLDREDVAAEVTELAATAQAAVKEDRLPDESFVRRRLKNIEALAPDLIDTIATTAAQPVAGVKEVWAKIVAKAREFKAARPQ
jgi:hypothetical protein